MNTSIGDKEIPTVVLLLSEPQIMGLRDVRTAVESTFGQGIADTVQLIGETGDGMVYYQWMNAGNPFRLGTCPQRYVASPKLDDPIHLPAWNAHVAWFYVDGTSSASKDSSKYVLQLAGEMIDDSCLLMLLLPKRQTKTFALPTQETKVALQKGTWP